MTLINLQENGGGKVSSLGNIGERINSSVFVVAVLFGGTVAS